MDKQHIQILNDESFLKFVQLYIKGEPFLIADTCNAPHSVILERILKEHSIKYNLIEKVDIPCVEGEGYKAVGMGIIMKGMDETYLMGGYSLGYGLTPHKEHLEKLKDYAPNIKFKISSI